SPSFLVFCLYTHRSLRVLSSFPTRRSSDLLLDAHRMLGAQSAKLQDFQAYVKLFKDAFPEEYAQYDATFPKDLNVLINDLTVLRSEEHTSELQSHLNLVCRLLLEKKKIYST